MRRFRIEPALIARTHEVEPAALPGALTIARDDLCCARREIVNVAARTPTGAIAGARP